ncbi:hypothetical protein TSUD_44580 [Trifolium subterraneum]|nr:hypothetical protein TSUD_44580 [Trifolium subterraneum]
MERYYKFVVLFLVLIEIAQICLCANSNVPCIEQERQALLDFKASLSHDSLNNLSSWKGTHCCQWEGIGCDNVTGHVVKLDLKSPSIMDVNVAAPNVSSSLLQLEHLTYLDLTGSDFSLSPIPMFIGSMGRLEYLSLSRACFSGMIPNSLENLKNLHFLDLSFNYYESYYPEFVIRELQMNDDSRWISKLHSLKHLDLGDVRLNETHNLFQVLNTLPSLLFLSLYACGIENSLIPHYALQNMTSLVYLDLSLNGLHGPIPEAFQNRTSIESLYLSYNSFTFIPTWFRNFEKLTLLDLSYNDLHEVYAPSPSSTIANGHAYTYAATPPASDWSDQVVTEVVKGVELETSESKGDDEDDNEVEKVLFYFVIALGFATGLWGFIGTLWFKKNWRHAYFRWVEDVADKIYVAFVIKVPKIKKKMMRNHVH